MQLRGIPSVGKMLQKMRQIIHDALYTEEDMRTFIEKNECNEIIKDAIVRIIAFIPCILHMETRVAIKYLPWF